MSKRLKHLAWDSHPVHEHDCDECVFLGYSEYGGESVDFYYCDKASYRTYIARWGYGGDYSSYLGSALDSLAHSVMNIPWYAEVLLNERKIDKCEVTLGNWRIGIMREYSRVEVLASGFTCEYIRKKIAYVVSRLEREYLYRNLTDETLHMVGRSLSEKLELLVEGGSDD